MKEAVFETYNYQTPSADELDMPGYEEGPEEQEQLFTRLDGELTPLVAANAHVIAKCWWMGDAEVSLSTAMNNYHSIMTEENVDMVIADVLNFIANPVIETPEPKEAEAELEQPEPEEAEPPDEQEDIKLLAPKTKPEPIHKAATEEAATKPYTEPVQARVKQSQPAPRQKVAAEPKAQKRLTAHAQAEEERGKLHIPAPNLTVEVRPDPPAVRAEHLNTEAEKDPGQTLELPVPQSPIAEKILSFSEVEIAVVVEPPAVEAIVTKLFLDEETVEPKGQLEQLLNRDVNLGSESNVESLSPDEPYKIPSGASAAGELISAPFEAEASEPFIQPPRPLAEAFERFEAAAPEVAEELNECLEEIVQVVELRFTEVAADQRGEIIVELEGLIVELFELAEVEFSPEEVRQCAVFFLACVNKQAATIFKDDGQISLSSPTHEFINEPILGLINIQKTIASFALGRSATKACLLNFS